MHRTEASPLHGRMEALPPPLTMPINSTPDSRIIGDGEMAQRTREFNWAATPLGAEEDWPEALVITLNAMLANGHGMLLWWGPQLVQFYNDAYRSYIGSDRHPSALGMTAQRCWPEAWSLVSSQIESVMREGRTVWHEDQLVPIVRDGVLQDVYWTYSYSPVRDAAGSIRGVLVTCTDTTARVLSQRQLQQVLEATTDCVISLDREWTIRYMNGHARALLAGSGDVLNKNAWEMFPGMIYPDSPYERFYRRAMNEAVAGEFEAYYPEPLDGWFRILARPAPDGIILFFREVTEERKKARLLIQNEKLAAVGRLAASIAHEINNPLESVTNLVYLARTTPVADERQGYLEAAERELRRVAVITSQTLRFHRQSTRPEPARLAYLLETVLSIYGGRLLNAGVTVQFEERTERPVMCYEGEIRQVLSNLVGNAIDAMPGGGRLRVRSREATGGDGQRGLAITVADTGSGMAPATARRIFEPFYSTKGDAGTGLGLWVSREIAERHGGRLRVRSRQAAEEQPAGPHGTVFTLFLPFDADLRRAEG